MMRAEETSSSRPPQSSEMVTAIVLAGGGPTDKLARAVGAPAKALVPLKEKPLGAYVLDALLTASSVRRIVWVGATDRSMQRALIGEHRIVDGGPRLVDSVALGVGAAMADAVPGERFLIVSADVPWLRGEHVDRFVASASLEADLVYPVVMRDTYERAFKDLPRTWVRLREGQVTGGNLVLGRPEALRNALPWLDLASRARKAPLQLAWRFGPVVLATVLLGQASLELLEERIGRVLGARVQAIMSLDAEVGTDVDDVSHLPATLSLSTSDVLEVSLT